MVSSICAPRLLVKLIISISEQEQVPYRGYSQLFAISSFLFLFLGIDIPC